MADGVDMKKLFRERFSRDPRIVDEVVAIYEVALQCECGECEMCCWKKEENYEEALISDVRGLITQYLSEDDSYFSSHTFFEEVYDFFMIGSYLRVYVEDDELQVVALFRGEFQELSWILARYRL